MLATRERKGRDWEGKRWSSQPGMLPKPEGPVRYKWVGG